MQFSALKALYTLLSGPQFIDLLLSDSIELKENRLLSYAEKEDEPQRDSSEILDDGFLKDTLKYVMKYGFGFDFKCCLN